MRFCIVAVCCLALTGAAHAGEHPAGPRGNLVDAALVSEAQVIAPGEPFWVAVRLVMADDWHVNWRNPGDAGLAPTVAWELPDGFEVTEIQWPYPRRFVIPELAIFGYDHVVLLPVEVTPPAGLDAGSVRLRAHARWLACREACVPGEADLELELTVGDKEQLAAAWRQPFDDTRWEIPVDAEGWRFGARLGEDELTISASPPGGEDVLLEGVYFFPNAEGLIENAAPQRLERHGSSYELVIDRAVNGLGEPSRLEGVLVSARGWGRIENKAVAIDIPLNP